MLRVSSLSCGRSSIWNRAGCSTNCVKLQNESTSDKVSVSPKTDIHCCIPVDFR